MTLKKKKILQIFFLVRDLNPIFFELLIDSVKDLNKNLVDRNKRLIKLKKVNRTIALFSIYLTLFSTKKVNTQKNEKQIYVNVNKVEFLKEKQILLSKVLNRKVEPKVKIFFVNFYLSPSNNISNFHQIKKSAQILKKLKLI